MNIIVFSKNRPAQLDLFLSSMAFNFPEALDFGAKVLYKADKEYQEGYEVCRAYHPWIELVSETNFKQHVIDLIDDCRKTTMFAVDDIVWKNKFSVKDLQYKRFVESRNQICLSLRLWPGITYSYMLNRSAEKPRFVSRFTWCNFRGTADWCYPMSVDCNIYQTADIKPIVQRISFSTPNSLEGSLARHPIKKMYMQCYPESKIINIPANKVQIDVARNRSENRDCFELNREFIKGKRLAYKHLAGYKNNAVHEPMELVWRS